MSSYPKNLLHLEHYHEATLGVIDFSNKLTSLQMKQCKM